MIVVILRAGITLFINMESGLRAIGSVFAKERELTIRVGLSAVYINKHGIENVDNWRIKGDLVGKLVKEKARYKTTLFSSDGSSYFENFIVS